MCRLSVSIWEEAARASTDAIDIPVAAARRLQVSGTKRLKRAMEETQDPANYTNQEGRCIIWKGGVKEI